jgi:hypothetical protein
VGGVTQGTVAYKATGERQPHIPCKKEKGFRVVAPPLVVINTIAAHLSRSCRPHGIPGGAVTTENRGEVDVGAYDCNAKAGHGDPARCEPCPVLPHGRGSAAFPEEYLLKCYNNAMEEGSFAYHGNGGHDVGEDYY